ncbi:MAG: hypothetical protein J0H74_29290 [Chitinophagaceae bacterium]|nr:hypothetical protein [Chitinophagaceae bacterium]
MTPTYLLLRDNKQSGPYAFDELKAKGLKAYDLVWIEGRSAAWRYPCEIEELSAFAPMVEEQPFDRFYKKPAQLSATLATGRTSVSEAVVAASVISGDASAIPGKRIIYVTLPAVKRAVEPSAIQDPLPVLHEKYLPDHSPSPIPSAPVNTFEDNTSQYTEDDISGVEIAPRAVRRHRSSRIGQSLVIGLTVIALLAAGIFIGLSINKDSLGFVKNLSLDNGKVKPEPVKTVPPTPASHPLAAVSPQQTVAAQALPVDKDSIVTSTQSTSTPVVTNAPSPKTIAPAKERTTPATQKTQLSVTAPKDSALPATPSVHRETSHRTELSVEKVDKDVIRNNLSNLVSLGASGYTVGTFGGISDLQLTVSNHSVYSLDLVVVEVQYIQANKKVFKTENLYFRGIAPGSALMQEAPKSSRGIKVQYKITLVNSKELGLSYSAL